ncbi:MAG TPA: HlyD family efflux transporter periplasmic adaptor subunit [Anaeromyxobacteraceae bacterium]|nr:HlyD family efflux transporter periplasmic adaptor subunit [Anaeromyxobacteraceae bacterium]
MRRMVIVFGVLALALGGLIALRLRAQAVARNAPPGGSGEIEGTEVTLSARITARVESLAVRKGQAVKAGDPILKLECSDQQAALGEVEARLLAARAQAAAASATVDASRRNQEAAAASRSAARAQAEALAAQRDAAARRATRLESLTDDVSVEARDQSRAGADALKRQVEAAEAQARASAEQARAAENSIRASGAQATAAEAGVKAAEETAVRARLLAAECQVKAPRDGLVDDLPHEPGELVATGQPLARLVDLSEVKAVFYLPNAEVAAARPGGRALVVADAWPGESFEGKVATVSAQAEFTPRNIQTRSDRDRLVYPVEVRLANPAGKLRPGMPVQVTLPREK